MQSRLNPYISFKDNAREAMEFYKTIFGGKLEFMTFKGFNVSGDPAEDDKIMHSMLEADNGITFMGADTPSSMQFDAGSRVSMALSGDNMEELKGYFDKLSAAGTVTAPFATAPWGDSFGMCIDKFGVTWMVNVAGKK